MSGTNFHLTPLESRKQLLLVESELNRAQLINELHAFKSEVNLLKEEVHAFSSIASSAAKLVTTFSAIRTAFTHRGNGEHKKSSWISIVLNGARTGISIWNALRSQPK